MMTLRDFRESVAADLRGPAFQQELTAVAYEEEGDEGVARALKEIAPYRNDVESCENELPGSPDVE